MELDIDSIVTNAGKRALKSQLGQLAKAELTDQLERGVSKAAKVYFKEHADWIQDRVAELLDENIEEALEEFVKKRAKAIASDLKHDFFNDGFTIHSIGSRG